MPDEHPQQPEFGAGQHHHAPIGIDQMAVFEIEDPTGEACTADRQRLQVGRQRLSPAQHVTDAGKQFARFERLGQIVIGAHLQPQHAVDRLAARGQHDHRRARARAQVAAQGQAVFARQVEVEHDQVHVLALQHLAHALAIAGRAHLVAGAAELFGQQLADVVVVVDDQQSMHRIESLHAAHDPLSGAEPHPVNCVRVFQTRRRTHTDIHPPRCGYAATHVEC
ncbi:hypothetical protein D3C71_1392000 [compost metagenome]